VIGLASSGLHSNGYTLARKVLFDIAKLKVSSHVRELSGSVGEELLKPTRIYAKSILKLVEKVKVKGIAHITGGGFPEKLGRILPRSVTAIIDSSSWRPLPIFGASARSGKISKAEMFKTFNMGIGMAVVVGRSDVARSIKTLKACGERAYEIGTIRSASSGKRGVIIK